MCCSDTMLVEVNWKYAYKPPSIHSSGITGNLANSQYPTMPPPKLAPTQLHSTHCKTSSSCSVARWASLYLPMLGSGTLTPTVLPSFGAQ